MANYLNPSTEAKLLRVCDDEMLEKRSAGVRAVLLFFFVLRVCLEGNGGAGGRGVVVLFCVVKTVKNVNVS